MSFFDDDDEPIRASRTRPARPRAAAPGGRRPPSGGGRRPPSSGTRGPDAETARQRQIIFGVGAIVLFVVVVLLFNSCQSSRRENALKDYNRQVTELASNSDTVGKDFFAALDAAAGGTDVEVRVNQLRQRADELVKQAKGLQPRGELAQAQYSLELVLNLRAQGLRKIAEKLPAALVRGRDNAQNVETALRQIAGQMEQFLASDVIYSQRTAPSISEALSDANVTGQRVTTSRFLPNLGWLNPNAIADRLGSVRAGGGKGANPKPAPGLHGHSLDSVSSGTTTLQPGTVTNTLPARPAPSFTVKLTNGGDSDETEVPVTIAVDVKGKVITKKKTIALTKSKQAATVTIPLGVSPPSGAATLTVTVGIVPGETKKDNNKQTYTILFRG
jgi:hypothetical protein